MTTKVYTFPTDFRPPGFDGTLGFRWNIIQRYARVLGGGFTFEEDPDIRPAPVKTFHKHPGAPIQTSAKKRTVRFDPIEGLASVTFVHEMTHMVWGTWPKTSEAEWACGMITFEMTWVRNLCGFQGPHFDFTSPAGNSRADQVYRMFADYSEDGRDPRRDLEWYAHRARTSAQKYNLPLPPGLSPKLET